MKRLTKVKGKLDKFKLLIRTSTMKHYIKRDFCDWDWEI